MKESARVRSLALGSPPVLNPLRNITVAIVICVAFAAAVYFAIR